MENSFKSVVESANSIVILLPNRPFFDQVAAASALNLSLGGTKTSMVHCASPMLVEFNRLVGVDKVVNKLGNKNLVITFSDYPANDIERVSYDIENGQFKLTVIPKSGMLPPTENQAKLSHSGLAADLVILIGGANESHFSPLASSELGQAKLTHLGTKSLLTPGKHAVMSFAKPASSTSEVAYDLIKKAGFKIDNDIASNLLMGIEEGSRKFLGNDVSADTFQAVADLMRVGGKRTPKQMVRRQPFPGSIPQPQKVQVKKQQTTKPPKDWLGPKIYKGTTVS